GDGRWDQGGAGRRGGRGSLTRHRGGPRVASRDSSLYKPRHLTRGCWPRPRQWVFGRPVVFLRERPHVRGGTTGEIVNGATRLLNAPAVGGWRSLWPSGPSLESEDARVHLRDPQ